MSPDIVPKCFRPKTKNDLKLPEVLRQSVGVSGDSNSLALEVSVDVRIRDEERHCLLVLVIMTVLSRWRSPCC